jgi:hypothetical protein
MTTKRTAHKPVSESDRDDSESSDDTSAAFTEPRRISEAGLISAKNDFFGNSVRAAVVADLSRLTPRLDKPDAALMALALTLAETLDGGAGMATAAVARELRATLAALTPEVKADDDGFAALIDQLRAPMGNAPTA